MNTGEQKPGAAPPAVFSAPPQRDLEHKLSERPDDVQLKVDVGSDESMDASDPPSVAQPGDSREPSPSAGFRE